MKSLIFSFVLLAAPYAYAQHNIAFVDVEYVFNQLPQAKQIEAEMKSLQAQLEGQLKVKYAEFKKRVDYYTPRENTMTEAELQSARKELQTLQDALRKTEQDSDATLQRKHKQLMDPVTLLIQKAISDVAQEKGYDFILNAGAGNHDVILFAEDHADVSELILKKLGINTDIASQD